jgi:hypothetical protein
VVVFTENLAAIDPVLLEPFMQTAGPDSQFIGGLLDLLARTVKHDRAGNSGG